MAKVPTRVREGMSFVTMAICDRRPIFEISRVADVFVDVLKHYRMLGHYKLHAYVVMPDHVLLVLTPHSMTLEQAVNLIKSGFEHRLETDLPIWDASFTGYSIASNRDLEIVRTYLHELPVRANLVAAANLYPHSSAYHHSMDDLVATLPLADPARALGERMLPNSTATSIRKKAS